MTNVEERVRTYKAGNCPDCLTKLSEINFEDGEGPFIYCKGCNNSFELLNGQVLAQGDAVKRYNEKWSMYKENFGDDQGYGLGFNLKGVAAGYKFRQRILKLNTISMQHFATMVKKYSFSMTVSITPDNPEPTMEELRQSVFPYDCYGKKEHEQWQANNKPKDKKEETIRLVNETMRLFCGSERTDKALNEKRRN